ncbi:GTPase LSG1-2 [Orobanche minor]
MVVDARDSLFYRCPDLEAYAREIDEHKRTLLLVNKADLLPYSVRDKWAKYFHQNGILFVFWSAKAASAALEGKNLNPSFNTHQETGVSDTRIYGRDELLARLQSEAEDIVSTRIKSKSNNNTGSSSIHSYDEHAPAQNVTVGFVGYPNVGKSSTINALVGEKRTGVTSTPGKTKHFQTLIMSEKLTLCDCPGLVFPSFTSSRYEMIASGVLPIDRMTEQREAMQVVANRVPRHVIEGVYRISLPKPKSYEAQDRPPLGAEVLRSYCASRGYVASSGLPDETRAARQILKDYIDGKLPHFEMPPGMSDSEDDDQDDDEDEVQLSDDDDDDGDEDVSDDCEGEIGSRMEHVMSDLISFDMDNGLDSTKVGFKEKPSRAPHKQHKKPQRKKDRSWRVRGSEGDGMPVVRVFQKAVNRGPLNA